MKLPTGRSLLLVSLLSAAVLAPRGPARAQVSGEVSLAFDAPLAPYGEWVVVAHHGRVWRPRGVAAGWRPYFHGRWIWTADGWFWDSDEPWGWATYHYGRWDVDPAYGWVWVPGYAWAPAWVTWRFGGGAIGWAPLLPGFSVWWTAGYPVYGSAWVFVPERTFVGARVDVVAYSPARTAGFLSTTRFAPPRSVSGAGSPRLGGPPRRYVEQRIGRPIVPTRVTSAATPEAARAGRRDGVISVYRPSHQPSRPVATRPAPHAATARSAPHAVSSRSAQHAVSSRSAQHVARARPAPHAARARPAQHAAAARPAPNARPPSSAVHHPASPGAQGRPAPMHRAPPTRHPEAQTQGKPDRPVP
jgi:hypothetical protein